ncbi:MAG: hypothetical protein J1F31_02255 [Erysipelotrichales bacterium]|nr:hypothetical protein [Erysipelotrichales bacterium]
MKDNAMKLYYKDVTYTSKATGKEVKTRNFYLVNDSGLSIVIKNAFQGDYNVLKLLALPMPKEKK